MRRAEKISKEAALAKLEAMCAVAEHCSAEIRNKLRQWNLPQEDAREITEILIVNKYVDDSRFAKSFVHDKVMLDHWGRRKIAAALFQKSIAQDVIDKALRDIDDRLYIEAMEAFIESRIRIAGGVPADRESRQKLFRTIVQRGYEPTLVLDAIKRITADYQE